LFKWSINTKFHAMCSISIKSNNTIHWSINENITILLVISHTFFLYFTRTIATIWDHFFKLFHTIFFISTYNSLLHDGRKIQKFRNSGQAKKFFFNTDILRNLFAHPLFFPFLQFFYRAFHHFFQLVSGYAKGLVDVAQRPLHNGFVS